MRLMTVTILTLAVLASTAHAAEPPGPRRLRADHVRLHPEEGGGLAAAGDRVSAAIRGFTRSDAASQDATFEEMRKHLSLLRPVAEEALKGYADFRTASLNLRKDSRRFAHGLSACRRGLPGKGQDLRDGRTEAPGFSTWLTTASG